MLKGRVTKLSVTPSLQMQQVPRDITRAPRKYITVTTLACILPRHNKAAIVTYARGRSRRETVITLSLYVSRCIGRERANNRRNVENVAITDV